MQELNTQLESLKQEFNRLDNEARNWLDKRDEIHHQIRNLREQVDVFKNKRDEANKKVLDLKNLREKSKTECLEKRTRILETRQKLENIAKKMPFNDLSFAEKELQSLEWKIQTTSLPVKEERELIEQIKIRENMRNLQRKFEQTKHNLDELKNEEYELRNRARAIHEELSEFAEQSQEFHREMFKMVAKMRSLRSEADAAHLRYVDLVRSISGVNQRSAELLIQVAFIKHEIRKVDEEKRILRQKEMREETIKVAQERAEKGRRMTLQEFKLLLEEETEQNIKES